MLKMEKLTERKVLAKIGWKVKTVFLKTNINVTQEKPLGIEKDKI